MLMRGVVALLLIVMWSSLAQAQRRLALLIGNANYNAKVGLLKNPHKDVAVVASALEAIGFKTTILKDASRGLPGAGYYRHSSGSVASDFVAAADTRAI